MHIRRSVVSKIIHPRSLYKNPKHTRLSASCVSDFYKVTSGWIILTNDLSNVHYLYNNLICCDIMISNPSIVSVVCFCFHLFTKSIIPYSLQKTIEWIISSHYGVKKFQSSMSEFHSILTPVEWKFTTQRVESLPVYSIFTPKEVITEVTPQWQIEWKFTPFLESNTLQSQMRILRHKVNILLAFSLRKTFSNLSWL